MYNSIYEVMEETGIVDKVLLTLGILIPLLLALDYRVRRATHYSLRVARYRILLGVGAPALYILWITYNAIFNHYGLSSVFAFFLNLVLFLLVGGGFVGLDLWLRLGGLKKLRQADMDVLEHARAERESSQISSAVDEAAEPAVAEAETAPKTDEPAKSTETPEAEKAPETVKDESAPVADATPEAEEHEEHEEEKKDSND
ncbi:hypothetical protein GX645_07240 [Candidatus Sumerlaeota bacterium]|nr:hypothetical protein [Candidatus Sumerlaeota bacterium]